MWDSAVMKSLTFLLLVLVACGHEEILPPNENTGKLVVDFNIHEHAPVIHAMATYLEEETGLSIRSRNVFVHAQSKVVCNDTDVSGCTKHDGNDSNVFLVFTGASCFASTPLLHEFAHIALKAETGNSDTKHSDGVFWDQVKELEAVMEKQFCNRK